MRHFFTSGSQSIQKSIEATLWVCTGLRKGAWNRRKGGRHNFWKNNLAQGHNWNQLKSNGSKLADKSNSTKPWSSTCKLNNTPRGSMTIPRHHQKTKEWVVPQFLEWSSHSLAYEITKCTKTNHTFHGHHIHPLQWHTHSASLWTKHIYLLPVAVSLNEFFLQWDIKNLSFTRSWNQALWILGGLKSGSDMTEWLSIAQTSSHMGLGPNLKKQFQMQLLEMGRWWPVHSNSGIGGERSWRTGGKSSVKNMLRHPFYNLPENRLNAWPVPTVPIGLILGTEEVNDRGTLTHLGNSY